MTTKTALIYGISLIIGLCGHSWLQRPEPFRRPVGLPPVANLTFRVVPQGRTGRLKIVAIDSLTGEMWYTSLSSTPEWTKHTNAIRRR